jgi:hypothetical protein
LMMCGVSANTIPAAITKDNDRYIIVFILILVLF